MISAICLIFAEFACKIQQTEIFIGFMCAKFFFLGRAILSCTCVVLHESSFSLLLFSRAMRELCAFVGCSA